MTVDLDELERLHRDATPGPWYIAPMGERPRSQLMWNDAGDGKFLAELNHFRGDVDGPLIVALRNAAPGLIAELRRLRELEAALLDCITTYPIAVGSGAKKNKRLQHAVEVCRAAHEGGKP